MIRTIIIALALVPASLAAKPLPPEDTERLLAISVDLDRRGFEQEADDVYAAATQRAFYKDDHPKRDSYAEVPEQPWSCDHPPLLEYTDEQGNWMACPLREVPEQPWSCEDYLANDEAPFPGCAHEPRGKAK